MKRFFEDDESYKDNLLLITDKGEELRYQDLDAYAKKMTEKISKRCLVFLYASNTSGSIMNYLAVLRNKIVPVLLSSKIDKELSDNLLQLYKPSYIMIPESERDDFSAYEEVICQYGYVVMKTQFEITYPIYEGLALLLTTSGSTGSPKLVRQSYQNIAANAASIAQYLELDETERPITTLPMNYTYGLSIINSHVLVGATLLVTEKGFLQKEFWNFFKQQGATSFGGVPYNYEMLDKLRFTRMELPSLRTMTQAGGKLSPELHKKFAEYAQDNNKHFVVMYGQCEATARMAYLPYEKSVEKYGSMGIAIPGGKFKLIDEAGQEIINSHETGELVYEGENVTLGYAESGKDLVKKDERQGVLYTGDMAQRDDDGYYYIVGRKKRFLKIYGNRVNLDEIERLVKGAFHYTDCACAGVDDHMYLFLTDDSISEQVKRYITEKTGLNHVAFQIKVIPEIPKNDAGKTRYVLLEQYY